MATIERSEYLPRTPLADELDVLGATVDARWAELERDCRMPDDVVSGLAELGVFDQLMPVSTGLGVTPLEWFQNSLRCAWWNGSFGWIAAQGAGFVGAVAIFRPELSAWLRERWPRPILAMTNAGLVQLARHDGQWTANGTIAFASGCEGADFIFGMACERGVKPSPETLRFVGAPRSGWEILHDWNPVGLRGTGSHSIKASDMPLDDLACFPALQPPPESSEPTRLLALPLSGSWIIAMSVAATQLGIARRALDEAYQITASKRPAPYFDLLDDRPTIRYELMALEGRWHRSVADISAILERLWETALNGDLLSRRDRALQTTSVHLATLEAVDIVTHVWQLVGTSALDPAHPIARCARDIQPMTGHISCNHAAVGFAAAVWRGEDLGANHIV